MAEQITKDNFTAEVLNNPGVVLADFYSETCVPCKRIAPVLEELEEDYEGAVKIAKVNVNHDSELAAEYGVQAVPTIIFFKDGEEKSRTVGLTAKEDLAAAIDGLNNAQ